ncbi:MAG: hypothetical protein HY711_07675 [Candidatus Melainabacteria bacterium]|nr:hypothetical protein [Candidatus Melainabacteria bacterium]
MDRTRWITQSIAITLGALWLSVSPGYASPTHGDYFARVTQPSPATKPGRYRASSTATTQESAYDTPVQWFESFDECIAKYKPSAADKVILSRPFNQEAERVEQWIEVATKVAQAYRTLAKIVKAMPVPNTFQGVKEYRDLTTEWYNDAAEVYEDLIRPRLPSQTMEELEDALNHIKQRSESLSQTNKNLKAMDLGLRKTYKVHLALHEDALQEYIRRK